MVRHETDVRVVMSFNLKMCSDSHPDDIQKVAADAIVDSLAMAQVQLMDLEEIHAAIDEYQFQEVKVISDEVTDREVLRCLSSRESWEWGDCEEEWCPVACSLLDHHLSGEHKDEVASFVKATMNGQKDVWLPIARKWEQERMEKLG